MSFETIDEGYYSAITDSYFGVITNEVDWMDLCRRHHGNTMEMTESGLLRPLTQFHDRFSVNFREEVAVYVFMGQKAPSGYSVQIHRISTPVNGRSTVYYGFVKKALDVVTMALTSPFHIVKVQKSSEHCSNFNFNEVPAPPSVPRVPEVLQDAMEYDLTGMKLYNILEISKKADEQELQHAHQKLAQKFHPDRPNGDKTKFQQVLFAYDMLSDTSIRKKYDEGGWKAVVDRSDWEMRYLNVVRDDVDDDMQYE